MRPRVLSIAPYVVGDNDAVALVQTPAAGGVQELTINGTLATGGVATMDIPRQVTLTFNDDDRARVFVVTGTDSKGNQRVEAVQGVDTSTTSTVMPFATVTSIKVDDDTVGNVQAGTGTVVSTGWLPLDYMVADFDVALGITVPLGFTADLTVELTLSNILDRRGNAPTAGTSQHVRDEFGLFFPEINVFDHDSMVNIVADTTGNLAFPVRAVRLKSNATLTGTGRAVDLEVVQASPRTS
jgi:hypothetical protein